MTKKEQTVVSNFISLVKIDSPSGFEKEVRNYLIKILSSFGFVVEIDGEGNLFAKLNGEGKPRILNAHMDTVEPGRGIKPQLKNGIIKSDGTTILGADNKVSIAAILSALELTKEVKRKSIEIVFSSREETDGGINKFDFTKLKSSFGLVADSSTKVGTIVLSSPWIDEYKIEVDGIAAHSGTPEVGLNALNIAAKAYSKIHWGRVNKSTTANIGLFRGGNATNTIPDNILLEGEVRSFSKKQLENHAAKIFNVFEYEINKANANMKFRREPYCQGYLYKRSDPIIKQIIKIMRKVNLTPEFENSFGGSDANAFISNGINIVNIADGTKDSHTVNENVEVSELVKLTDVFVEFITGS